MASQDFPIDILDFLKRAALGEGRIVSSGDLTTLQIAEAQAVPGRFYVDPATSLGWAILPWHLRCPKDKEREDARITLPASSSPSSKQEDDRANAAKDLVAEEEIRRRSIRPGDVTLSVRRHGEGVTADIWPLPDQIHDTTVREFIELLIGIAQRIEILPTGVFVRPDHPATTPPDSNPPAKSEEPTKPTQSVQPWPEDMTPLFDRTIRTRHKEIGAIQEGVLLSRNGVMLEVRMPNGTIASWNTTCRDLLSVSSPLESSPKPTPSPAPEMLKASHDLCVTCGHLRDDHAGAPFSGKTACSLTTCSCSEFRPPLESKPESVQSEPIKDLVEQARQISKPQSVQSEGNKPKVVYLRYKFSAPDSKAFWKREGDALTYYDSGGTAFSSVQVNYGPHITPRDYEEFFPTQPKDSKEMVGRDIVDQIHKTDHGPAVMYQAAHVIDELRSALKSANERAEAAEKELATLKAAKAV